MFCAMEERKKECENYQWEILDGAGTHFQSKGGRKCGTAGNDVYIGQEKGHQIRPRRRRRRLYAKFMLQLDLMHKQTIGIKVYGRIDWDAGTASNEYSLPAKNFFSSTLCRLSNEILNDLVSPFSLYHSVIRLLSPPPLSHSVGCCVRYASIKSIKISYCHILRHFQC